MQIGLALNRPLTKPGKSQPRLYYLIALVIAGVCQILPTAVLAESPTQPTEASSPAQQTEVPAEAKSSEANPIKEPELSMEDLRKLLDQQRTALTEQDNKIKAQEEQLEAQKQEIREQRETLKGHVTVLNSLQTQLDQLAMAQGQEPVMSEEDKLLLSRLQVLEEQVAAIPEDPSLSMEIQPGAIPLPGTNASIKIGGFVKASIIRSFDDLESVDRFIVGTIPVTPDNDFVHDKSDISAAQSRINIDLREKTELGSLRAFVEGDFKGSGDSFRLRHAYGQFRDMLAGKTWSVFYDPVAHPHELDFEGVNGQVLMRNAQLRYFPSRGKAWDLAIALEAPDSEVNYYDPDLDTIQEADGVSDQPDLTFSIKRNFEKLSHMKVSGVIREISARSVIHDSTESDIGWGVNVSGVLKFTALDSRDTIQWQVTYGEGVGRYVNDLNSVGGMDGVFDSEGKIQLLPVLAAYASYQHWWNDKVRSSFLISGVWVDNYSFQPDDSYLKTERVSANVVYSPVPRFDLGAEIIWGRRTNEDKKSGSAVQALVTGQFRF